MPGRPGIPGIPIPPAMLAHPLALELLAAADRLVDGRHHEVLEHLDLVGIDRRRIDLHAPHLLGAGDDDPHGTATGGGLEGRLRELLLRLRHLRLHLLRHLGDLADVHEGWSSFGMGRWTPRSAHLGCVDELAAGDLEYALEEGLRLRIVGCRTDRLLDGERLELEVAGDAFDGERPAEHLGEHPLDRPGTL